MKKATGVKAAVAAVLFCVLPAACPTAHAGWEGKGAQMVGEIITNPGAFFNDFQQDLEATQPLPPGDWLGFQTGVFPTTLPMTMLNASAKIRLHEEGRLASGLPQLDLFGGCWDMVGAKLAEKHMSDDVNSASFRGNYFGAMLASSLSPRVRLFWGYKHSKLRADLNLKKSVDILGTQVSSFQSGFEDNFFIAGIEHATGLDKFWSIQLNYGLSTKSVASKISWYGRHFEWGINIYPEGVLVLHPVLNYHLNF